MRKKIACLFISSYLAFSDTSLCLAAPACELDNLYSPLVPQHKFFYSGDFYYYQNNLYENHGTTAVDKATLNPRFYSLSNLLKFSPLPNFEAGFSFREGFPSTYYQEQWSASQETTLKLKNHLSYFNDYGLSLRLRRGLNEFYFEFTEKRQKFKSDSTSFTSNSSFSFTRANYEDFKAGLRYLSEAKAPEEKSNLAKIEHHSLADKQLNIEAELGYKKGKVSRHTGYLSGTTSDQYGSHDLNYHFIPELTFRYGLTKKIELESGLRYSFPFKYDFNYHTYYSNGTALLKFGTYKLSNDLYLPFKLRYRPLKELEVLFSCDYSYAGQKLDYYRKNADDSVTDFSPLKLTYYNAQPGVKISYLYDGGKSIKENDFSLMTKELLLKNQYLIEFQYQKDLTYLKRSPKNGTQNIIDPYGIFMYPLELFVGNTEFAARYAGNTSYYSTNISPQNFFFLKTKFTYGLRDFFNLALGLGYQSSSTLHQFFLPNYENRFYKFKPYYFIDFFSDLRLSKNSILNFKFHFVPEYKTIINFNSAASPEEYRERSRYFDAALSLKILF